MMLLKQTMLNRWPALRRFSRVTRFGLVGLSGVVINSMVLWLLVHNSLPLLAASPLATEVAIINNFILNDRWTFRTSHLGGTWRRFARFNAVALGGMVITVGLLSLFVHLLPLLVANVLAVGGALAWNYIINTRWTWSSAISANDNDETSVNNHFESTISTYQERPDTKKSCNL